MSKKQKVLTPKQLDKIGDRFATARKNYDKNISYRKFANVMGLAHSTIRAIECGNQEPSLKDIKAYMDKFGGSYDYWLGNAACKVPSNEEITKITGLSDDAIEVMKTLKELSEEMTRLRDQKLGDFYPLIPTLNSLLEFNRGSIFFAFLMYLAQHIAWSKVNVRKELRLKDFQEKFQVEFDTLLSINENEKLKELNHMICDRSDLSEYRAMKILQELIRKIIEKEVQNG